MNVSFKDVLDRNALLTVQNIRSNIDKNGQNATGRLSASVREETTENTLYVFALDYIDTLENGASPQQVRRQSFSEMRDGMKTWLQIKHNTDIFRWIGRPYNTGNAFVNMWSFGSTSFHAKWQKKEVYTQEAQNTVERLKNEIADVFIQTKIL